MAVAGSCRATGGRLGASSGTWQPRHATQGVPRAPVIALVAAQMPMPWSGPECC